MKSVRPIAWLVIALALCAAVPGAAQKKSAPAKKTPPPAPAALTIPFHAGEVLDYKAGWENYMSAAELTLRAPRRTENSGRASWNFQATAQTISPVKYLFAIDDRFDAWADAASLATRTLELHRHEPGKQDDRVVHFLHEGEAAPPGKNGVRVTRDTRDPITALFFLRTVDWAKTKEAKLKVYDGEKFYDVTATLEATGDTVDALAGKFSAWRINFRIAEQGRERSDLKIRLWIATDDARTPVQVEAELPFGKVRVLLARKTQS